MATPATDPRDVVRRMWREAARSDAVGSFRQLGGDSLSGLRLLGAIYKTLGVRLTWTGSPALPYEPLVTASEADRFWRPRRALADQTFALAPARVPTCAPEVGERLVRVTETSVADCASRAAEVHAAGVSPFAVVAAGVAAALAQWSAERTFAVRIPFSHRRPEEDRDVSYRVRLLPVLAAVAPAATAGDLIGAVGEELSQAALHSIGARTPSRVRSDRRPPRGRSSW
jgi:hypothetical protein